MQLDDIFRIDWRNLTHALGAAEDVPQQILGLMSDKASARAQVLNQLYSTIWHEGMVFEATAYAVPFLIQLLEHPNVQEKDQVLVLLSNLASGQAPVDVMSSTKESGQEQAGLPNAATQRRWAYDTYKTVMRGISVFIRLLEKGKLEERIAAPYVLSCFDSEADKLTPILISMLKKEQDPSVQGSILMCLGTFVSSGSKYESVLLSYAEAKHPRIVRAMAALAVGRISLERSPTFIVRMLIDILNHDDSNLETAYQRLPWANGSLAANTALLVCVVGEEHARWAYPDLMRALTYADGRNAQMILQALLLTLFPEPSQNNGETVSRNSLSARQFDLLDAVANHDLLWARNFEVSAQLRSFGLPDWPEKIQTFLARRTT